jgi:hypothetical protein
MSEFGRFFSRRNLAIGVIALAPVGFAIGYVSGSSHRKTEIDWPTPPCIVPQADQMKAIEQESRREGIPICDEKPIQPVTIRIPASLLEPVMIPPMAKG